MDVARRAATDAGRNEAPEFRAWVVRRGTGVEADATLPKEVVVGFGRVCWEWSGPARLRALFRLVFDEGLFVVLGVRGGAVRGRGGGKAKACLFGGWFECAGEGGWIHG